MRIEQAIHLNDYTHLLSITLLYYDYVLTLPAEVSRVWARPLGASSVWFLLNRYLTVFGNIAVSALVLGGFPAADCGKGVLFHQILLVGAQVVVCIILTIRTYALYNKSKRVLALILTIALSLFAVSCWGVATQGAPAALVEVHGIQGCHWAASMTSSVRIAIAWEALFALDCLFFGLTLARTWQVGVARGRWRARTGDRRLDLVRIMRRDGAMYFGAIALANLSNLVTFYLAEPLLRGVLSTFASALSVTLASRLILNLHAPAHAAATSSSATAAEDTAPPGIFTTRLDLADDAPPTPDAEALGYELEGGADAATAAVEEGGVSGVRVGEDADGRFGRQWGRAWGHKAGVAGGT